MTNEEKRSALEEIANAHDGLLRPEDVVNAATSKKHPLHHLFEWNDSRAAHEHRLNQARQLIKSVKVVVTSETKSVETVYYVRDPRQGNNEQGYVALPRLKTDSEIAANAVAQEFGRALAALQRARDLTIAIGVQTNVDHMISELQNLLESLSPMRTMQGAVATAPQQ